MSERIAIVGIACRYPDADTIDEFWENILAGRRAFRTLPDERMRLEDYWAADPKARDRFYARKAAVLEGFEFDRVAYRIAGSTFRSTDLTHWLALDTAARALADAGFPSGEGLPRSSTGVVVGNTLTGEFSRANLLRLRWPYVRRTLAAALTDHGWDDETTATFLNSLEERYKAPFPEVDEDMLAGGLSNTIAGRLCNYFDFNGGGYTVDGACSSSLLSVATACNALARGEIDAALAGGVDLSIDPFEIIGFAKTGALATSQMRVYDRDSNGFWPGEGCGMLVLMRESDAVQRDARIYALISGWGYSSDGKGGITRPEADGHRLALKRAYRRAGFGIDTVGYLEGHGTGTAVGDATELRAFSAELREAAAPAPVAISTIKGNIGHTKAAAGVAGLIKAALAVHREVIPPATGHHTPHPELTGDKPALIVPGDARLWPDAAPIRAGISSMGFGGINAHVVLEHAGERKLAELDEHTLALVRSRQDVELLLLDAPSLADLRGRIAQLETLVGRLSFAELADVAATLQGELSGGRCRAAVVAADPDQAQQRLGKLLGLLDDGARSILDPRSGLFLGSGTRAPRIGFLFPGQGSGRGMSGGALRRRFAEADEVYRAAALPEGADAVATAVAQPRIVTGSLAGLRVLSKLGIEAEAAVGHSLGELTSLHWGGAMNEAALLDLAAARGRVMAEASADGGAMAGLATAPDKVRGFIENEPVVIAGYNSPTQTVVSGPTEAVERVCAAAAAEGITATRIAVSHAFHSPAVEPAAEGLAEYLAGRDYTPLRRTVVSTVTGEPLPADEDLKALLRRQVLEPVRFAEAVDRMAEGCDLLIEVGPGRVLTGLAGQITDTVPAVALDTDAQSLTGLFAAVASAFVLGTPVRHEALFADRLTRPLPLDKEFSFLASPCETVPAFDVPGLDAAVVQTQEPGREPAPAKPATAGDASTDGNSLELLMRLAAERAELPLDAVHPDNQPLDDLHLSSITVGQILNQASTALGLNGPVAVSNYATATLAELAAMLDELADTAVPGEEDGRDRVDGVAPWVRAFSIEHVEEPRPPAVPARQPGAWQVFATDAHPLAGELAKALGDAPIGDGVLLCLPHDCGEQHVPLMLRAARAALGHAAQVRFVVVQDRRGACGLAKTLHLEAPGIDTTIVTLPLARDFTAADATRAVRHIVEDVAGTSGFSEVVYDAEGVRRIPVLRPLPVMPVAVAASPDNEGAAAGSAANATLGSSDVILVTGGGKGITAESALALTRGTGAALGILGRSDPAADPELAANLKRFESAGVAYRYLRADVTQADEVKSAVNELRDAFGPVTAVLHGAGRNEPTSLPALDEAEFRRTLAPKIGGLEAVLAAVDPGHLRLLITFGSIIGRAGLRGEAHYATANDWLTELTAQARVTIPGCRCIALEWSVWAGAGMGERLGVLESLIRDGISPIPIDEGIAMLSRLLADPDTPETVVVMGRVEQLPTVAFDRRELPLLRFTDRVPVHYPGVELVAEAELSADGDLYLADHLLDGDLLFPAVFGMEAMAQAAAALTGRAQRPSIENAEFLRPIVVPPTGSTTIRVAVLGTGPDRLSAVIRSSETGFKADHFRAELVYESQPLDDNGSLVPADGERRLALSPHPDLYGPVLFQGDRFQRVEGYSWLAAKSCVARISTRTRGAWFSQFYAAELVLGDPGARDAFMHAIQCCVPDATLLPAAVESVSVLGRADGELTLEAKERSNEGDTYVYDLDVRDASGQLVERWRGLRLQAVRKLDGTGPWMPILLGPYIERAVERFSGAPVRCAIAPDGADGPPQGTAQRRERTAVAVGDLFGRTVQIDYRPDGKPQAVESREISSAHGAGLTFAVAGDRRIACDVETAGGRTDADWADLLGVPGTETARLIASEYGEPFAHSAARVWGAFECLSKAGFAPAMSLSVSRGPNAPWVLLRAGNLQLSTLVTRLTGVAHPVSFVVLTETGA